MYRLLETIKIKKGIAENIKFHQNRIDFSLNILYGKYNQIGLEKIINNIKLPNSGVFKFRFLYNNQVYKYEILPYKIKRINSLKIVRSNINYNMKFANREEINYLFRNKGNFDDILIVKEGLVTDTSYANILLYDGKIWKTPAKPLLNGTKRQKLLQNKEIIEEDIYITDIKKFQFAKIINAMIDLEESPIIKISNIE